MIQDQPPPTRRDGPAVWPTVIEAMKAQIDETLPGATVARLLLTDAAERHRVGCERYGTPLQAHNGRDALVDCYQEQLDAIAYSRQWYEEHRGDDAIWRWHHGTIDAAIRTRAMLFRRDGK